MAIEVKTVFPQRGMEFTSRIEPRRQARNGDLPLASTLNYPDVQPDGSIHNVHIVTLEPGSVEIYRFTRPLNPRTQADQFSLGDESKMAQDTEKTGVVLEKKLVVGEAYNLEVCMPQGDTAQIYIDPQE